MFNHHIVIDMRMVLKENKHCFLQTDCVNETVIPASSVLKGDLISSDLFYRRTIIITAQVYTLISIVVKIC